MPKKASRRPRKDLHKLDARVDTLALLANESTQETLQRQKLEKVAVVIRNPSMDEFLNALAAPQGGHS